MKPFRWFPTKSRDSSGECLKVSPLLELTWDDKREVVSECRSSQPDKMVGWQHALNLWVKEKIMVNLMKKKSG